MITTATIENSPATNIGDLLRAVPGMNVTQVSARDVNITTRGATSTLSTSQLALVDGRSVYLDFFGMVMWDLVPTNPHEIKQIEVVRGPASAVWGANAMTGVVNVITRSPRELARDGGGNAVTIGFGGFNRDVTGRDQNAGTLFYVNGSHAERRGRQVVVQSVRRATSRRTRCRVRQARCRAARRIHRLPTPARRSRSSTPAWTTT